VESPLHCTTRTGGRLGTKVPGTAGSAALPVPDVIEEMVSRVLEDGSDVLVADGGWSPPRVRLF
jgi:hypothetical protein